MRMVIGGCCQGKLELVLRQTGYRMPAVCDGATCPLEVPQQPVLNHLQLLLRRLLKNGQDPVAFAQALAAQNPEIILITDEIGGGIVPIDRFEREWREAVGRACCLLAERSGRVDRVFAGLPCVIKRAANLEILMIRHAKTAGNLEGRYIGQTDEPLAVPEDVKAGMFPVADRIYTSPLMRCRQTAALLYPDQEAVVVETLKECYFGNFEGKSYQELKDLPEYQAWIAAAGKQAPPNGERQQLFKARCCYGFAKAVQDCLTDGIQRAAFVLHGGSMMAVLEHFAASETPRSFYQWQADNLCGWAAQTSLHGWVERRTLWDLHRIGGEADT
ncbi:MAG: hypothetical protein HFG20_08865 [Anaerotruncus sp.]|jgi:alpha-ribazole phosphatase|nr:hypothetical protein [Anaerotruncus sp.]